MALSCLILLLSTSAISGRPVASTVPAERSWTELTRAGTTLHEEHGWVTFVPPTHTTFSTAAGLLWSRTDNGENWIGKIVGIGDKGGLVFTEYDGGVDRGELLSAFDLNPPTPVWAAVTGLDLTQCSVAAADGNDTLVTLHQLVINGNNSSRPAVLSKYRSRSPVPDWTYPFVPLIGSTSKCAISRDGSVIAAMIVNNPLNRVELAIFGPDSNVPQSYTILNIGSVLRAFLLSADGTTAYFGTGDASYIFDVATAQVVYAIGNLGNFEAHAISGDGSVFAFGGFNKFDLYERSAGWYTKTYTRTISGSNYCGRIAISDDSRTIAYAFNYYDLNLVVQIEALDVPTKQVTMSDLAIGAGTYQNLCSDIAIDADGGRFVAGLYGDQANLCPEVRLYKRDQNLPVTTLNLPGSVFDVDISADGERVAVAAKAVHANVFAGGGEIDAIAFEVDDLRVHQTPHVGSSIQLELTAGPLVPARMFWSPDLSVPPKVFPNIGTLYLLRSSITTLDMGSTDATGAATQNFQIGTQFPVGQTLYFQGFSSSPRKLIQDWVKVRVLP